MILLILTGTVDSLTQERISKVPNFLCRDPDSTPGEESIFIHSLSLSLIFDMCIGKRLFVIEWNWRLYLSMGHLFPFRMPKFCLDTDWGLGEERLTFSIYELWMKRDIKNKFGQNGFLVDLIRRTEWWESSQQGTSVLRSLRKAGSRWWMEKQRIYFLRRSFI